MLECGIVPALFAECRTVLIPKSSDVDNGRIVRSPEALHPLTQCNCDCKILTTAICRGLHWYTMRCIHSSQRCFSSRSNDGKHFRDRDWSPCPCGVCSTRVWHFTDGFAVAYPGVNHSLDLPCIGEKQSCLSSSAVFYGESTMTAPHASNSQE